MFVDFRDFLGNFKLKKLILPIDNFERDYAESTGLEILHMSVLWIFNFINN